MIAIYPGAFKPPHRGHFNVVKSLLDGSYNGSIYDKDNYKEKGIDLVSGKSNEKPNIDKVIVFVGAGERNGIDKDEALTIWNIYARYLGNVEILDGGSNPMFAAKDYAQADPETKFVAVTGIRSEEDFVDLRRVTTFKNAPNVQGLALASKPGSGVRATDFRKNILSGNLDQITDFFPKDLSGEEILKILNDLKDKIVAEILANNIDGFINEYFNEGQLNKTGIINSVDKNRLDILYNYLYRLIPSGVNITHNRDYLTVKFDNMKEEQLSLFKVAPSGKVFNLIQQFRQEAGSQQCSIYDKRDNCGPAALDFISWAESKGIKDLKRIRGFFRADIPVSGKRDFTREMKQEFLKDGGNWNSAKERFEWISNSKYKEQWKYIPHFWVEDSKGRIYDTVGQQQFIDAGYSKDLNSDRYTLSDILETLFNGKVKRKQSGLQLKDYITSLTEYMLDIGMNITPLPEVVIKKDQNNANNFFGRTAYYSPSEKKIVLYITGRHNKDIVRSYAHEMVHHMQNLQGVLNNINTTDTNSDDRLLQLEKEAYTLGNITFRNWEDSIKNLDESLWANINAKKKSGKKSSHKNSKAYKAAKKAGTALKKSKNEIVFSIDELAEDLIKLIKEEPKKGTGKKPKGSSRRLYTDEDPKDTVGVKFSSRQDIVDTLNKKSFKAKSHARQSQIINLIHQRTRAAYNRAKKPDVKKRLKSAFDYIKDRKEASKKKTQRLKKSKK